MSWESKRDHKAIEMYNKMLKKPPGNETYSDSEIREASKIFEKIKEYRKRAQEGFKPSKLFMVWRIDHLVGRPIWEKDIIIELGLAGDRRDYAIVKNTPSMNKKLWQVKHLIRIQPITFPDGFPEGEDYRGTYLKSNGELMVSPRLKVSPELLEDDVELKKKLDPRTVREDLRLNWDKGYQKLY